jgi:DNA-binding LytR/AlgR family response regulator
MVEFMSYDAGSLVPILSKAVEAEVKVLIISNEANERKKLRQMVQEEVETAKIWEEQRGMEAIKLVKKFEPDVLFIDVNLPDISGLQAAEIIRELGTQTHLIIMGEEHKYAIDSFRLRAFYYLLKPFQTDELFFLLDLLQKEARNSDLMLRYKLPIEYEEGILYVAPEEIAYINKNKECKTVSIHTADTCFVCSYKLQELEDKLSQYSFLRVHKSYLINLEYVRELKPYYNGTYNLYLDGQMEEPIPVSRNYVKQLRNKIEI